MVTTSKVSDWQSRIKTIGFPFPHFLSPPAPETETAANFTSGSGTGHPPTVYRDTTLSYLWYRTIPWKSYKTTSNVDNVYLLQRHCFIPTTPQGKLALCVFFCIDVWRRLNFGAGLSDLGKLSLSYVTEAQHRYSVHNGREWHRGTWPCQSWRLLCTGLPQITYSISTFSSGISAFASKRVGVLDDNIN